MEMVDDAQGQTDIQQKLFPHHINNQVCLVYPWLRKYNLTHRLTFRAGCLLKPSSEREERNRNRKSNGDKLFIAIMANEG